MKFTLNEKRVKDTLSKSDKSLMRAGVFIENKLKEAVAYDTGDLKRSINTKLIGENHVRVGSNKIQAYVEEKGRNPGKFPNMNAIAGWVGRRGIISGPKTKGYDALNSKDKSIVYLIARKIKIKGIKAKETFSKIWNKHKNEAMKIYFDGMKD